MLTILFALSVFCLFGTAILNLANESEKAMHRAQTRRMLNMIAAM